MSMNYAIISQESTAFIFCINNKIQENFPFWEYLFILQHSFQFVKTDFTTPIVMLCVDSVLMMHRVINLMERARKDADLTLKTHYAKVSTFERLPSITAKIVRISNIISTA